jgi:hypothetical protein
VERSAAPRIQQSLVVKDNDIARTKLHGNAFWDRAARNRRLAEKTSISAAVYPVLEATRHLLKISGEDAEAPRKVRLRFLYSALAPQSVPLQRAGKPAYRLHSRNVPGIGKRIKQVWSFIRQPALQYCKTSAKWFMTLAFGARSQALRQHRGSL